eukprot:299746_1
MSSFSNMILLLQRIILVIISVVCLLILLKEIRNRQTRTESTKHKNNKWMHIFSMLTMIGAVYLSMAYALSSMPVVCIYISRYFLIPGIVNISLTFYQIRKLQICFSSNYWKYIYGIFYLFGILLIIVMYYHQLTATKILYDSDSTICSALYENESRVRIYRAIITFSYYFWDFSVIIMYVHKIRQLKRKRIQNNWKHTISYKKVDIYLRKIIILTITLELYIIVSVSLGTIIFGNNAYAIWPMVNASLRNAITSYVMYIMIDDNYKSYILTIKLFLKFKICCCCQSFVNKSIQIENESTNNDDAVENVPYPLDKHVVMSQTTGSELTTTMKHNSIGIPQLEPDISVKPVGSATFS